MNLAPDSGEAQIAEAAADFLLGSLGRARLHRVGTADLSAEQRGEVGGLGWFGLALPEQSGGSGLSAVEHALFFREAGRQCAPVDLLAQSLAANMPVGAALRESVLGGAVGVGLAVEDAGTLRVYGNPLAEFAIAVRPQGAALYRMAGVKAETRPSLVPSSTLRVIAGMPPVEAEAELPDLWVLGELATAAMLVGIAEAALELIAEYAKVRETFGRKIGAYQAVRHPCADMLVRIEAARAQLYFAATAIKEAHPSAQAHLDAAKHLANQAALANSDANIQLHGGIGVTEEHDAHLLHKQALLLSRLFGARRAVLANLLHQELAA
ncbi:MAG: acyl-CoA dehydrogenase family protein [Rhizobiaceae bacterium]|nr:acyl-CoA dehydrogenase family protein [Rhizobiaceae bacterium]